MSKKCAPTALIHSYKLIKINKLIHLKCIPALSPSSPYAAIW
uniref:Uncharacterized protein n=1 Tax=uncultured Serratia sp. TaxID=239175 RepID=A0A0S1NHI9_9GAMM|nr:hypothetical protein [uncultured Serratia sp.]